MDSYDDGITGRYSLVGGNMHPRKTVSVTLPVSLCFLMAIT